MECLEGQHKVAIVRSSRRSRYCLRWSLPPVFGLHSQTTRLFESKLKFEQERCLAVSKEKCQRFFALFIPRLRTGALCAPFKQSIHALRSRVGNGLYH